MSNVEKEIWKEILDLNNLLFIFLFQIFFSVSTKWCELKSLRSFKHLSISDNSVFEYSVLSMKSSPLRASKSTHGSNMYMDVYIS